MVFFSQLHPPVARSIFRRMGICIYTVVDPKHISRSAWQRVYDETVTVLRAWPDPPIRPRYREIELQRASLPELQLLAMLASHPTSGLIAHQLRRAVFESVAVRRFCLQAWDTTEPVIPYDMPVQARLFDEACAP